MPLKKLYLVLVGPKSWTVRRVVQYGEITYHSNNIRLLLILILILLLSFFAPIASAGNGICLNLYRRFMCRGQLKYHSDRNLPGNMKKDSTRQRLFAVILFGMDFISCDGVVMNSSGVLFGIGADGPGCMFMDFSIIS